MPDLFHLDDYDKCMLNKETALYCTFSYKLEPLNSDNRIWDLIQVTQKIYYYIHCFSKFSFHRMCLQIQEITDMTSCDMEYALEPPASIQRPTLKKYQLVT